MLAPAQPAPTTITRRTSSRGVDSSAKRSRVTAMRYKSREAPTIAMEMIQNSR